MPFLKEGALGIINTLKYLEAGRLLFKKNVKIFTMNHIPDAEISEGANKFLIWKVPQLQFKNPNVQIITFSNMTPTPFIKCYLDNDEEVLIDVSFHDQVAIEEHLLKILCKTEKIILEEEIQNQIVLNPANFGTKYPRHCICEVYGQVRCPSRVGAPKAFEDMFVPISNNENVSDDKIQ